jgi:phosphonate dehydrogenase
VTRPRIVVTNWVHDAVRDRLLAIGELDCNTTSEPWPSEEVARRSADADAVLAFMTDRVDAALVSACPRLRIVACALKGFDNFDVAACTAAGVWVTVEPDLLTEPTAELAVGLAIGLGRMIRHGDALVRSGAFHGWKPILYGAGLAGAVIAIVGMGEVGRAIARGLSGFGCTLLGVDPAADMPPRVAPIELAKALASADYVILAAPLTPATRHLIGREALATMKQGARLINVGRGSVVDETAVADALEADRLGGYAADVFAMEDWALAGRPRAIDPRLLAHPRTLFTPHLGSAVDSVRRDIAMRAADNIAAVLAGRAPPDAINMPRLRVAARR